jgi:hypothetical protein
VPILPVSIAGSGDAVPCDRIVANSPAVVTVAVHEPIPTGDLDSTRVAEEALRRIEVGLRSARPAAT